MGIEWEEKGREMGETKGVERMVWRVEEWEKI